jgi:hypothetical protein
MRIELDILNASNARLGSGPAPAQGASMERRLDGAGSISVELPGTHPAVGEQAADGYPLIDNERRASLHTYTNGQRVEIGRGIIRKLAASDTTNNWKLTASGPDDLDDLKRFSCHAGTRFVNQMLPTVAQGLINLVPGWAVTVEPGLNNLLLNARFDGETVLKAFQQVASQNGLHLRAGSLARTLEIGRFGSSNGVTLLQPGGAGSSSDTRSTGVIETLAVTTDSAMIANRIFVFGAGTNLDSSLTLERSTRTTPYPVKSMTVNGRRLFYLEDVDSIARYGLIEKYIAIKEIAPLANTDALIARAADALYDAAVAWLTRNSRPNVAYSLTVRDCQAIIRPGDKVRVVYRGFVEQVVGGQTVILPPRDINAEFWVLSAREQLSSQGRSLALMVAEIDRYEQGVAEVIVGALEQVRVQGMKAQPSFNVVPYGPYREDIASGFAASFRLPIRDAIFTLDRALLILQTRSFRSNVQPLAHRHQLATFVTNSTVIAGAVTNIYDFPINAGGTGSVQLSLPRAAGASDPIFTAEASPGMAYGMYSDTQFPTGLTVRVNNQVAANNLFPSGGAQITEIDITSLISSALRQTHQIDVTCTSGRGTVEALIELWVTVTPIRLS